MPTINTPPLRLIQPRPIDHALSETSSAAPHWGIHDGTFSPSQAWMLNTGKPLTREQQREVDDSSFIFRRGYLAGSARWPLWFASGALFGGIVCGLAVGYGLH